jgi:hypothetical protein
MGVFQSVHNKRHKLSIRLSKNCPCNVPAAKALRVVIFLKLWLKMKLKKFPNWRHTINKPTCVIKDRMRCPRPRRVSILLQFQSQFPDVMTVRLHTDVSAAVPRVANDPFLTDSERWASWLMDGIAGRGITAATPLLQSRFLVYFGPFN